MRIIAGAFKGRNLLAPLGKDVTRPITGSVKKSLFGMLGEDLSAQVVADLYCGTGTLGIEALSRGADRCYFAERDAVALERLRRNLQDVGAQGRSVVWRGDIESQLAGWLAEVNEPLDIAFVDPPYATARAWNWAAAVDSIFAPLAAKLAGDGVAVLRCDDEADVPETLGALGLAREKRYGNMVVRFFTKRT